MAENTQCNLVLTSGYTDKMDAFNDDGTSTVSSHKKFLLTDKEVVKQIVTNPNTRSYIRSHFATMVGDDLGVEVPHSKENYVSQEGDILFIASYNGPRIKKTDVKLSDDASIIYKVYLMGDHPEDEDNITYINRVATELTDNPDVEIVDPDTAEDPEATELTESEVYHAEDIESNTETEVLEAV